MLGVHLINPTNYLDGGPANAFSAKVMMVSKGPHGEQVEKEYEITLPGMSIHDRFFEAALQGACQFAYGEYLEAGLNEKEGDDEARKSMAFSLRLLVQFAKNTANEAMRQRRLRIEAILQSQTSEQPSTTKGNGSGKGPKPFIPGA